MPFEHFVKISRVYTPKVSIWNRGQICFNQSAINKFDLNKYKYISFYFDKELNRIGFFFTSDSKEGGLYKISIRKMGLIVSAKAFLQNYGINHDKTKKYDIDFDVKLNLYFVNLNERTNL